MAKIIKQKKDKKHNLTIFLLKERYKKLDDVIYPDKEVVDSFDGLNNKAKAFLYKNNDRKPSWVGTFSDIFDCGNINNTIHALIVYLEVDNRIFAITTSFGHAKIKKEFVVNDFGLRVVLNKVDKEALRGIDVRKLTLSSHQRREVSSSNSSLDNFEFDSNEDFLKMVSGKLDSSDNFAISLSGSDSLNVIKRFDIKEIQDFCAELLELYEKRDYIDKGYDFIDNLKKISDSEIYLKIKKLIAGAINKRDKSSIILAYPEIEECSCCSYRVCFGRISNFLDDINIDKFFEFLDKNAITNLTVDDLKNIRIELLDEKDELLAKSVSVKRSYSLFDYLVFEVEDGGNKYIFINSQLFLINKDYYLTLCDFLKGYEIPSLSINLPKLKYEMVKSKKGNNIAKFEDEGDYNNRIESIYKNDVVIFDKKSFLKRIGGKKSNIEVCDILTKNREFICVKIYKNSSSALSHLFFQGSVSAELLLELDEYKEEVIKRSASKFTLNLDDRPEIKFVLAIADRKDGLISENLPIFSKISLRKTIMDIKKMSFDVAVFKIGCEQKQV